jgi:hypothetical protein
MKRKIHLHAQFYENYNFNSDGFLGETPYWKPKGGHTFEVEVDSDWLMYADSEDRDVVFAELVAKQSNVYEKFEYVEFEFVPEISKISFEEFNNVYESLNAK